MAYTLDMTGRVVVVTGGAKGVGDGIVEVFLGAGASVEICGRSTPVSLREVEGRSPRFTAVDVRDPEAVAIWMKEIEERHGRLDVLVNNAGGAPFANFAEASPRFASKINELNFLSAAYVMHAAYSLLKATDDAVVLNITSISARRPSPGTAVYGAAKAALESLTVSLATEWAPDVRVNNVSCGLINTPGSEDHYGTPEQFAAVSNTIPRGQFATPAEVGQACLLLASPLASHVTGATLNVDGGGEIPAFLAHTPNA